MVFMHKTMLGAAALIAVLLLLYGVMRKDHTDTHTKGTKVFRIACILSDSVLYHEKAYKGFVAALEESSHSAQLKVTPLYVKSIDSILVKATCEEAAVSKYDLYVTFGHTILNALTAILRRRSEAKPVVSVGAPELVRLGLAESFERPGGSVTGVAAGGADQSDEQAVNLLYLIRPDMKKILLPCGTVRDVLKDTVRRANRIKSLFEKKGVTVRVLEFNNTSDVLEKVRSLASGNDVLMFLEGGPLAQFAEGFGKICSQAGVTLFSGSLGGVSSAALTYAVQPFFIGAKAFRQVEEILIRGVSPGDIPVSFLEHSREFVINRKRLAEQRCPISKDVLTLLERGRVV